MNPTEPDGPGQPVAVEIADGAVALGSPGDGALGAVVTGSRHDRVLQQLVMRAVALVAGCDVAAVHSSTDLQLDLGMSSLGLVELACLVQEALGLDALDTPARESPSTVSHVVDLVRSWLAQSRRQVSPEDIRTAEAAMVASCGRPLAEPSRAEQAEAEPSRGEPSGGGVSARAEPSGGGVPARAEPAGGACDSGT